MKSAMRVTTVISSMQGGGAERVMSQLVNSWADSGWELTVLTYESDDSVPFYPLHSSVRYLPLSLAGASSNFAESIGSNFRRLRCLRRAIRQSKPHAVLSFCTEVNVLTLLATLGLNIPVIVSERTNPEIHPKAILWKVGRYVLYPAAFSVVVQSTMAARYFSGFMQPRVLTIPNSVATPTSFGVARSKRILAVGRLSHEKGFDLLLHAFAQLRLSYPDWTLRIVGEGHLRSALLELATKLGVANAVEMPGMIRDIQREYATASVFVLSSRFEGFPNALCEAMAAGLPVVSFRCPGGVTEIVNDGQNGLLAIAEDSDDLARCIKSLLDSECRRVELGTAARLVTDRFSPGRVHALWTRSLQPTD